MPKFREFLGLDLVRFLIKLMGELEKPKPPFIIAGMARRNIEAPASSPPKLRSIVPHSA